MAARTATASLAARPVAACVLAVTAALGAGNALAAPPPENDCAAAVGRSVVLSAATADPDVFVWDSRIRLIAYAAGHWGSTREVLAHTKLANPGTRAVVIGCYPGAVRVRDRDFEEAAVGIRLTSGPSRGAYGWVLASDIHPGDRTNAKR